MSTDHNFQRERRAEAVSNRGPVAYQPTALTLGQTGSLSPLLFICFIYSWSNLPCCSMNSWSYLPCGSSDVLLVLSPLFCFMYTWSYLPCCSSVLCTLALISLARLGIFCNIVLIAEYSWWLASLWLSCKKPGKSLDMTGSYFQQVQKHHKSEKL